ncbi:hypothetical protein BT69DRAFT_1352883 [Atractiella rhizophila]|nr:hypothetical protein BT69DRAFT_1352883 [Atractiella rhizophila]
MAPLTVESATALLAPLERPETMAKFYPSVSPNVQWTVSNPTTKTHPIAGHYTSLKDFGAASSAIGGAMATPWGLKLVRPPIVCPAGINVVAELRALNPETGEPPVGKNGTVFDNRYSWNFVWDPENEKITEMRAYLDGALVRDLLS